MKEKIKIKAGGARVQLYGAFCAVAAFIFSLVIVGGSTRYLPQGPAFLDNIVIPISVFPLLWVGHFLLMFSHRQRKRVWLCTGGNTCLHLALILIPLF